MFVSVVNISFQNYFVIFNFDEKKRLSNVIFQSSTVFRFSPTHIINYYTLLPSELCYLNIVNQLLRLLVSLRYKKISVFLLKPHFLLTESTLYIFNPFWQASHLWHSDEDIIILRLPSRPMISLFLTYPSLYTIIQKKLFNI